MKHVDVFAPLSADQYSQLKEALPYITVLIAGADGTIDEQEINWAEKLTHIRTYAKPEDLNDYYGDVEKTFHERLMAVIAELPDDVPAREKVISERLSALNAILMLLDNEVAYDLYTSFTSFAKHIAKASGGFLRFGSISHEEKHWINLPMIDPIIREISDEEE